MSKERQWFTDDAYRRRYYEGAAVFIILVLMIGFVMSLYMRESEAANRISCAKRLNRLMQAATLYSQDYDGLYPPSEKWSKAMWSYVDKVEWFICPSDKGRYVIRKKKWPIETPISYWYTPPSTLEDASGTPMFGDHMYSNFIGNHMDGGNVAYADSHVSWITDNQWAEKKLPVEELLMKKRHR